VIRVLIAEDMHLIRGALVALLSLEDDLEVVAELSCGDDIMPAALKLRPDVAVLDIDLPGIDGLTAAGQLRDQLPECRTIILTQLGNPANLRRAMSASVRGFLMKDAPADELATAIRKVAAGKWVIAPEQVSAALERGECPLTDRELKVLRETAGGAALAEIATTLHLAPGTVRNYLSNVISKLGARNRIDATRIAREHGWL
jgi:two-component system response regulator DesR